MGKYGDIQYLVDRPEPSEIFLKARNLAGGQLQEQFNRHNQQKVNSSYDGFKWIKAELTYPSFDNLTFAYKNSIFSVVIELVDDTGSSFSQSQRKLLMDASAKNNLIPCLYRIELKDGEYLIPVSSGWNLYDPIHGDAIIPEEIADKNPTPMSQWELHNFAIQIVRGELEKDGNLILSFCDVMEINPQIWVKDKDGNVGWIIVKHITKKEELDYTEWVGLENTNEQLKSYDGFFAAVQFYSHDHTNSEQLFRGDAMSVNYKGLERIYVS